MLYKDLSGYRDIALLILRLAVAAIFFYFGSMKWGFLQGGIPEGVTPTMAIIMKVLAVAEPLAAVGLILGLLSQLASLGLCIVMISAIWMKVSSGQDMTMWALDLALLAMNVALILLGPGRYSLDMMIRKKKTVTEGLVLN